VAAQLALAPGSLLSGAASPAPAFSAREGCPLDAPGATDGVFLVGDGGWVALSVTSIRRNASAATGAGTTMAAVTTQADTNGVSSRGDVRLGRTGQQSAGVVFLAMTIQCSGRRSINNHERAT
jgi:hypothetical protein